MYEYLLYTFLIYQFEFGKDRCFMEFISWIKKLFEAKAPKVACPKCGTVHEINADCKCPKCGLKYKLPQEYEVYIEKAKAAASDLQEQSEDNDSLIRSGAGSEYSDKAVRETKRKLEKKRSDTLIKLSIFGVLFSVLFIFIMMFFFKDKDALLYKTGEYKNQPVFYHTEDGMLHCAFPNDKNCNIGKGELVQFISSADGKCVYLTYSGEFASANESNYVLRISKYGKKIQKIAESKDYLPHMVSGGNNKYLYLLTPKDNTGTVFDLTLSVDGEAPLSVAKDVREVAVSTSGRYALISLDENGSSKVMVYSAASAELTNPGIKNAHPLSIDNKGEYMIYARKNTADSTDIIVEKSTTERVEIPIFKETKLKSIIFSEDRRSFAAQYEDRTVFYTCTDEDYSISNTSEGSLFGYDFNDYVCHNYVSFKEIPEIRNVFGKEFLPYYYYDNANKFVYKVSEGGTRESVFDTYVVEELRVSDNERCAFVSEGILYTGKLDKKKNDITRIMNFGGCTLIDISPDGKFVYYTDKDGNMFRTPYGETGENRIKISVDPDTVKAASDGSGVVTVSSGTASFIDKKGNTVKIGDGFDVTQAYAVSDELSGIFWVGSVTDAESENVKKNLYYFDGKKSKLIKDKVTDICAIGEYARLDVSKSSYVNIPNDTEEASDAIPQATPENAPIPVPDVQTDPAAVAVPIPLPLPESQQ